MALDARYDLAYRGRVQDARHGVSVGVGAVLFSVGALGMIGLGAWAGTATDGARLFTQWWYDLSFLTLLVCALAGAYALASPYTAWPMPDIRTEPLPLSLRLWRARRRYRPVVDGAELGYLDHQEEFWRCFERARRTYPKFIRKLRGAERRLTKSLTDEVLTDLRAADQLAEDLRVMTSAIDTWASSDAVLVPRHLVGYLEKGAVGIIPGHPELDLELLQRVKGDFTETKAGATHLVEVVRPATLWPVSQNLKDAAVGLVNASQGLADSSGQAALECDRGVALVTLAHSPATK